MSHDFASYGDGSTSFDAPTPTGAPPTYASFSPVTLSATTPARSIRRSTVLVHQKSPLLLATPPQITRALAYSHSFLLPLNFCVGLLTWSTGDPWQSFLLLCAFWAVVQYGDVAVTWAGPVILGLALIAGMYGRRYSPLSTGQRASPASKRGTSAQGGSNNSNEPGGSGSAKPQAADAKQPQRKGDAQTANTKHQKTLDEIVETLKEFTGRCNVLLEPLLDMTDFLSTQRTPTRASTRPALIAMFLRLVFITPIWIGLSLPPWRIVTARRVVLVIGTLVLTWHARVARVTRAILWRSFIVRQISAAVTGLVFNAPASGKLGDQSGRVTEQSSSELSMALRQNSGIQVKHQRSPGGQAAGVKFTFIIYENQRRWVGLGWTNSLFAYERSAWTDEHGNAVPPKDEFQLPEVDSGSPMRWKWADDSRWKVEGVPDGQTPVDYDSAAGKDGWIFYDNQWHNGRRGQDGWGRWTRRRKWFRDAELVEVLDTDNNSGPPLPVPSILVDPSSKSSATGRDSGNVKSSTANDDAASTTSSRSFFRLRRKTTDRSTTSEKGKDKDKEPDHIKGPRGTDDDEGGSFDLALELQQQGKASGEWGFSDEARMNME